MSKAWTFAAGVAGVLGAGACALVTHFDPAVGADGGGEGCADSGALLCEDFEHGSDGGKWTDRPNQGGVWSLDRSQAHSGNYSLHLHTDASDGGQQLVVAWEDMMGAPSWPFPLYLRAYVYWTSPLANQVANFFQLQNSARDSGFVLYAGTGQLGWTNWPDGPTRGLTTGPIPGRWTCVEWEFNGTNGNDVEVLLVDGGASQPLADPSTMTFPFSELDIGMLVDNGQSEPAMDLYMDDVILDIEPIPCAD